MKCKLTVWWVVAALASVTLHAQSGNLNIYWIDVEGGASTLIVAPTGESLLVDTGNPTPDDRDARRIYQATQQAGLKKIDYLLITHFHGDHIGGAPALAKMIPIEHFLDHGDSIEAQDPRSGPAWEAYKALAAGKRTTMHPGDKLPVKGLDGIVVSANGQAIAAPINHGAANPLCQNAEVPKRDTTENERSVGFLLTYGKFKFLDLGDLTRDIEMELACPVNKLGTVNLFQATHHGFVNDFSGSPAHVLALKPQVIIVNNGPTKGWQNSAWDTVAKVPGLEDVWQVHAAMGPNHDHNVDERRIANLEPTAECKGFSFHAAVARDGKFTITNARNQFSKTYSSN
jgi:beta-lactamase superfamily II metal-dependent hydrolase